jgi:hypothetical protein
LLPGPCRLALPQVMATTPEELDVIHAECVSELVFECQAQPLLVSLWKREETRKDGRMSCSLSNGNLPG